MITAKSCTNIFNKVINDYHAVSYLEPDFNYFELIDVLQELLHKKCWIDTIQWHLEDDVRSPNISAEEGWAIKKKIDKYNQERTDTVEAIDHLFYEHFAQVRNDDDRPINSETPGWIIDRLSILCLKIFHMEEQVHRDNVDEGHIQRCQAKLSVLNEQLHDLRGAFDHLISDLKMGKKRMKLYLQMKMYNDTQLNPALYKKSVD